MAVFRVNKNENYTTMSNYHLRDKELSLKAKGLLSQMLSLPEDWDYTLKGLAHINRESVDAIRSAVWELERTGYIKREQGRDAKGKMTDIIYTIYEQPQPVSGFPTSEKPTSENPTPENPTPENPTPENPTSENPVSENPTQLNTNKLNTDLRNTDVRKKESIYPSIHPSEPETEEPLPGADALDTIEALRQQIRQNIDYDRLVNAGSYPMKKHVPEIYRLICDIVCIPQKPVRIAGQDYPYALVRERFLQLTGEDVEYVIKCMSRVNGRIGNIRAYLLTALYNAPASREQFFLAEAADKVRQDGGVEAFREWVVAKGG